MPETFDAVVAGAGPAGAQCARDLAARDYDVLVLETESEAEFPSQSNKSTAGTFPSMMAAFGIPDDVVMQFTDSVVLESKGEHYRQEQSGAVMDFAAFKQFLVRDGREQGAEYRFDARVAGPITEGDEVVGVKYNGSKEVRADVVVDATGPAATLARPLGVSDLDRERQAIGVEYEFEGVALDHGDYADLHDTMMLRLDHDIAPGGYAWIFHTGADTAKVGLCYIQNEFHTERAREGMTIDDYLEYWLDTDPRFADAERFAGRQHRGSAHIQPPGNLYTDGLLTVGDTVPTVDPVWGEGIRKGMRSGRAAAVAIDSALTGKPDTSAGGLSFYETLWHEEVAPKADIRLLLAELLYFAPDERFDTLLADLVRTDRNTLRDINNGNLLALRHLLHLSDIPLLTRFARYRLGDRLPF
jgi:digeranylgeranylglycerophospholipid reductase